MFGLGSKKTLAQSGILTGFTDYHSHILPGVDDGIKSVEEALRTLEIYEDLGVKKVVFTPHIMELYPLNDTESLRSQFNNFKDMYSGNINISLGAEYMLDNRFTGLLELDDLLPIMENHLLVETSFVSPPMNLIERLKAIQSKGYFVVLAHPERYMYMRKENYMELKNNGVLFQLNLLSIVGGYGKEIRDKAKELLHSGFYDLIGSDIHDRDYHIHQITHCKLMKKDIDLILQLKSKFY